MEKNVVCTVLYGVLLSVFGSVVASKTGVISMTWVSCRMPNIFLGMATLLFYTKVFIDDYWTGAKDDILLPSCISWVFFILQMALLRNVGLSAGAFIAGLLTLTICMPRRGETKKYFFENVKVIILASIIETGVYLDCRGIESMASLIMFVYVAQKLYREAMS